MANNLCRYDGFKPLDRDVIDVLVPAGVEYKAGQVIMVSELVPAAGAGSIYGNQKVWKGVAPATANLGLRAALIVNGGEFETLADGRRPEGNPDYTTYSYKSGDVAPAIILSEQNEFEISFDSIDGDGAPSVGDFLEPANEKDNLVIVAKLTGRTSGVKSALKVLKINDFRAGGLFGAKFFSTVIARVVE